MKGLTLKFFQKIKALLECVVLYFISCWKTFCSAEWNPHSTDTWGCHPMSHQPSGRRCQCHGTGIWVTIELLQYSLFFPYRPQRRSCFLYSKASVDIRYCTSHPHSFIYRCWLISLSVLLQIHQMLFSVSILFGERNKLYGSIH